MHKIRIWSDRWEAKQLLRAYWADKTARTADEHASAKKAICAIDDAMLWKARTEFKIATWRYKWLKIITAACSSLLKIGKRDV